MAAHLGFTKTDIRAIEHLPRNQAPRFRLYDQEEGMIKSLYVLQKWKNNGTFDKTATHRVLLEALISCECTSSAKRICSKQIISKAKITVCTLLIEGMTL